MCHAALKAALALNDLATAVAAMKTLVREGWNFGRYVLCWCGLGPLWSPNPHRLSHTTINDRLRGVYATLQQRLLFAGQTQALKSLMAEAQTSTSNQPPRSTTAATPMQAAPVPAAAVLGGTTTFPYHDTNACNLVLTELSKRRRFDLAYTFLSLMHELGLRADTVSYNILMDLALKVRSSMFAHKCMCLLYGGGQTCWWGLRLLAPPFDSIHPHTPNHHSHHPLDKNQPTPHTHTPKTRHKTR